jgi:hypothetical protein
MTLAFTAMFGIGDDLAGVPGGDATDDAETVGGAGSGIEGSSIGGRLSSGFGLFKLRKKLPISLRCLAIILRSCESSGWERRNSR